MAAIEGKSTVEERIARLNQAMTRHKDFPKPGIVFIDIFPVMKNPEMFGDLISLMVEHIQEHSAGVEIIVGLDARGFILGPLIAQRLGIGFVPIRKAGKLPGETIKACYELEYGKDTFEAQIGCVSPGQKVLIVDDLLATGGTLIGACSLMEQLKADVVACMVVIELVKLNGRVKIPNTVYSFIKSDD